MDPVGQIFRYPESIKKELHLKDWSLINLVVVEERLKEVHEVVRQWHSRSRESWRRCIISAPRFAPPAQPIAAQSGCRDREGELPTILAITIQRSLLMRAAMIVAEAL